MRKNPRSGGDFLCPNAVVIDVHQAVPCFLPLAFPFRQQGIQFGFG